MQILEAKKKRNEKNCDFESYCKKVFYNANKYR